MTASKKLTFFWFRRDLRLDDNAGLHHALKQSLPVQPLFLFDSDILDKLEDKADRRVCFIHRQLISLNAELKEYGSSLLVMHGKPKVVWEKLIGEHSIASVYTNHDYEPYAIERDESVRKLLEKNGIAFNTFKDQVIFEKEEVVKSDGSPYTVFTPYMKRWKQTLQETGLSSYSLPKNAGFNKSKHALPSLSEIGFEEMKNDFPSEKIPDSIIKNYKETRDFPGQDKTSHISVHLRFGTVSVRRLVARARKLSDTWLNELIWREFFMMLLWHFPHVEQEAFKKDYALLPWRKDEQEFEKWCEGKTGYPIVDAGMRELNETGFMHNRVRMITAMFLTKYLLIDWQWGEAYFAKKLLDFELSSNNGNWQWCAGTGADAAPYFRIFNMDSQTKRFDPDFKYIHRWVPELNSFEYPERMVDYEFARKRCLEFFKSSKKV